MEVTPNDIRNYKFPNQMRGYDKHAVDSLLEQVADELERLKQENLKLSMECDSVKSQLAGLRQFEDTIKNAAIDARHNADHLVANARREAELVLEKARNAGEQLVQHQGHRLQEIESQLQRMELVRKAYLTKLRNLISSHMDIVEEIAQADVKRDLSATETYTAPLGRPAPTPAPAPARAAAPAQAAPTPTAPAAKAPAPPKPQPKPAPVAPKAPVADSFNFDIPELNQEETGNIQITDSSEVSRHAMETIGTSAQHEQRKTEEANAPGTGAIPIVSPHRDEAAAHDDAGSSESLLDPELAAALASYKSHEHQHAHGSRSAEPPPRPGEFVETSRRAEDIPPGFISGNNDFTTNPKAELDVDLEINTDKVQTPARPHVAPEVQDSPTEHNAIDIDPPAVRPVREIVPNGIDIAAELDRVAEKFAEEMDRAAKS